MGHEHEGRTVSAESMLALKRSRAGPSHPGVPAGSAAAVWAGRMALCGASLLTHRAVVASATWLRQQVQGQTPDQAGHA